MLEDAQMTTVSPPSIQLRPMALRRLPHHHPATNSIQQLTQRRLGDGQVAPLWPSVLDDAQMTAVFPPSIHLHPMPL